MAPATRIDESSVLADFETVLDATTDRPHDESVLLRDDIPFSQLNPRICRLNWARMPLQPLSLCCGPSAILRQHLTSAAG